MTTPEMEKLMELSGKLQDANAKALEAHKLALESISLVWQLYCSNFDLVQQIHQLINGEDKQ